MRVIIAILFFLVTSVPASADERILTAQREILSLDIEELMNLYIITATRTNVKLKEAPATVYVITDKMIDERGYRILSDALHDVPGFDFQHTYGIWPDLFHQRGIVGNSQRSLLYVDDIPQNNISENAVRGGGNIRFPLCNVKRIEIVSGPVSPLFGANAFNGIINIITKDEKDDPGGKIYGTAGAYMDKGKIDGDYTGKSIGFSLRGKNDGSNLFRYSLSGYYQKSTGPDFRGIKNLDADNKGYFWSDYYNNSHDETYNLTAKLSLGNLRFEIISWQYLQGQGTFANGHYQIDTDKRGFEGSNWDYYDTSMRLSYLYEISPSLKLESELINRYTGILNSSHEQYPKDKTPDAYNFPNDVTTQRNYERDDRSYELEERLTWNHDNKFASLAGIEAIHTDVPEGYGVSKRHEFTNYGAYLQEIYRPAESVSLTGGYRFDYNTDYGSSHNPRVSAVWTRGDFVIKSLFSTGFRAPTAWELFNATNQRKSNPNLKPETMRNYEIGLGYTLFDSHHISLSAYYNEIEDLILEAATNEYNPSTGKNWNRNQNVGKAAINGIEASSDFKISDNLSLYAGYTYSDGRYKDISSSVANSPAVKNGDKIPNIAPHKINAGITYFLLPKLSFHLRANYIHKRETISTNPIREIDEYTLLHANIRWEDVVMKGFYLQLLCRNLLDENAFDPGVRTAEGTYYPTQHPVEGRNVWLTIGYKF
ncbi:MAG: TonB-dependent receptor [Nitrospirae bacterium]|nr:TonB-dependent receptor [Nitrospirota bacterium]